MAPETLYRKFSFMFRLCVLPALSSDGRCVKAFLLALMSLLCECVFTSHWEAVQRDTCRPLTLIVCCLAHGSNKSASVCVCVHETELVQLRGHHYHAPPWIMLSAAPLKWALQGQQLNYFYREALILHWRCYFQASFSSTLNTHITSAFKHTWAPAWTYMFVGKRWI